MSWSWALVIIQLLEDFPWPQKSVGVQLLDISFFISKLEKKSLLPPPPIPPMLRACELSFENRQNTPVPADNEIAYCSFWWVFLSLKWCTTWLIWKISVSLFCATVLLVFVKVNEEELMNINFNTASASKSSGSTLYDLSGSVELVHAWSEKETDTGSHPDGHQVPCLYVRPLASI